LHIAALNCIAPWLYASPSGLLKRECGAPARNAATGEGLLALSLTLVQPAEASINAGLSKALTSADLFHHLF
jgi:hypothetical protein